MRCRPCDTLQIFILRAAAEKSYWLRTVTEQLARKTNQCAWADVHSGGQVELKSGSKLGR